MANEKKNAATPRPAAATASEGQTHYLVQQGNTLRVVTGDEAPDLTVEKGEKMKKIIGQSSDRTLIDRIIKRQVDELGMKVE